MFDVILPYIGMTLEQSEIGFMRDMHAESEVALWCSITGAWLAYHEKFLGDETLPDEEERKMLGALIAISTGVEDVAKLNVPVDWAKANSMLQRFREGVTVAKTTTIADLISLEIKPEERKRRKPVVTILTDPLGCSDTAKLPRKYEYEVFNFLLANKDGLGVVSVFKFQNLLVDGAILLADGRRLAVEIKFRMNWTKALQAEMEFRRFLLTSEAKTNPVAGAIVFFEQFQGDGWHRKAKSRFLENGWNHWYANYFNIDGYRADLLRLSQGALEHYGLAMANSLIANVEQMSDEEKSKLAAALKATGTTGTP